VRCSYIPEDVTAEALGSMDAWRADSRTAACACLLLLCAVRETLGRQGDCLALLGALCDICAGLAKGGGRGGGGGADGLAWGCDLHTGAAQAGQAGGHDAGACPSTGSFVAGPMSCTRMQAASTPDNELPGQWVLWTVAS
jgi:hypothetical protein